MRTVAVAVLFLLFAGVSPVLGGRSDIENPSRWIVQTTSDTAEASPYNVALTGASGNEIEHTSFTLIVPSPLAWTSTIKTGNTSIAAQALPGRRYRYRAQALVTGAWGAWRTGPSQFVDVIEPSIGITLTGPWHAAPIMRAYSELPVYASAARATATINFNGRAVSWMAVKAPDRGRATVFVDGQQVATIDLYASTKQNRIVVFAMSWPQPGQHALRISVIGQPANRRRVDIDVLAVVSD